MVVATTAVEQLTRAVADREHVPDARIAVVAHPLGAISDADVDARAEQVVDDVLALLREVG